MATDAGVVTTARNRGSPPIWAARLRWLPSATTRSPPPGERRQRRRARVGPGIGQTACSPPNVVNIGHGRRAGRLDRGPQRRVQLVAGTGLQQQYGREQVPGGLGERHPFPDLLDEHVLVADDQTGLVGRRRDLIGIDHGEQAVRRPRPARPGVRSIR